MDCSHFEIVLRRLPMEDWIHHVGFLGQALVFQIEDRNTRRMDHIIKTAFALLCMIPLGILQASEPGVVEGTSSMEARQTAIRQLPLKILNEQARQKLTPILDDPSYFRRMPTQTIESDPEMFTFLVRHPEVLVNIWDIMGITHVTVDRLSPYIFQGKDGAGTECKAELIYGSEELHIYYGTGSYEGALVGRELKGRCVCILHSKASRNAAGVSMVTGQMDVFLKLDNLGADLIVKTIGPFVGKTADSNFVESSKFISQLSQASERNPVAVQQLASRMTKIQPAVRDQFAQIAAQVAKRNIHYTSAVAGNSVRIGTDSSPGFLNSSSGTNDRELSGDEVLQAWQSQSRVPPRDLHLRSIEKSESALRR